MGRNLRVARRRVIQRHRRLLGPWRRATRLGPLARRIAAVVSTLNARVIVNPTGVGDGCSVVYTSTAWPGMPAMGAAHLTVESVSACVASLAARVESLVQTHNRPRPPDVLP